MDSTHLARPDSRMGTPQQRQFRLAQLARLSEALAQERQQGLGHGLASEAVEFAGQIEGDLALCYCDSVTRHLYILLFCRELLTWGLSARLSVIRSVLE
jgi:hypothetical protein